jgi:serine/threonine protein phosphatase PrpC
VSHFLRAQYHAVLADAYSDLAQRAPAARRATVSVDMAADMFKRAAGTMSERLASSGIDTSVSGTTAVAMLVGDKDVFIANVGDSRAVVARFCEVEQRYVPHCESLDHKPDVPEELARIEASNGRVFEWGSFRVWLQDVDMPGLGMSRSFGDAVAKTVGVTSDPDVITVDAFPRHSSDKQDYPCAFAVLASDGIWEFFNTDECVEFVSNCILQDGLSPQQACDALVEEAFERWNAEEDVVDDITVALVFF